jgi:hypothetical protein
MLPALFAVAFSADACSAAAPGFPWHSRSANPVQPVTGNVPVQVLSQPATSPLQPLPPKQAYPYGYFGAQPSPQWKRSFGVSRGHTQWSRY